ncbi:RHS repeat-associated core domain-containing protein [Alteromonas macleodii]|uniref:RHS repeat-associated core domain-containing protein n=1 Tax=Alteromonas macleodii TaxID=28108 RepID=UPI00313B8750
MNGRIYDPTLGRFLQADPHIQAPLNSQNYNRYSYVLNNPMSYTDPSGYFFKWIGKKIKKYWRPIVAAVAAIATYGAATGWAAGWGLTTTTTLGTISATGATMSITTLSLGGYMAAGAISGAVAGAINTGSLRGILNGALSGAAFGGLGYGAHSVAGPQWSGATQIAAHAVTGGILSDLQGGNFGHGFATAGIMKGVGKIQSSASYGRTIIQAIAGGTVSKLTGGKFANGAMTAALQYVVNEISYKLKSMTLESKRARKHPEVFDDVQTKKMGVMEAGINRMTPDNDLFSDNPLKKFVAKGNIYSQIMNQVGSVDQVTTTTYGYWDDKWNYEFDVYDDGQLVGTQNVFRYEINYESMFTIRQKVNYENAKYFWQD